MSFVNRALTSLLAVGLLVAESPLASATQVPTLAGVWMGTDPGDNKPVVLDFRDETVVLMHQGVVVLATWTLQEGHRPLPRQEQGTRWELPINIEARRVLARRGAEQTLPKEQAARTHHGTILLETGAPLPGRSQAPQRLRLCLSRMGITERLPVVPATHPESARCMNLQRIPAPTTETCVEDCVDRNQMRATAPEVIQSDCHRECGPP